MTDATEPAGRVGQGTAGGLVAARPGDGDDRSVEAAELRTRLARSEREAGRQDERAIQWVRLLSIPPTVLQLALYPGPTHWPAVAAVAVLVATAAGVHRRLGLEGRDPGRRQLAWLSIVGDIAVGALLMANYRNSPADAVQFLPLLMMVQAAARWGRPGGVVGGVVAGLVSSAWVWHVHRRLGLDVPVMLLVFRVVIIGLVGVFVGMMVREGRQRRRAAEAVINASRDLVVTFSVDGTVTAANPGTGAILGYPPEEIVGLDRTALLTDEAETFGPVDVEAYRASGPQLVELPFRHRDGHTVWLELDLLPDLENGVIHAIGRDVSSRRRTESELRHRADHDGLTGVWNRTAFDRRLDARLAAAAALGLVFLDLDRFKALNDAHGHLVGDQALQQIAERLVAVVGGRGRVARYAGDEFCLVVDDPADLPAVVAAARAAMAEPFLLAGVERSVSVSLGAATAVPGDDRDALLHRADQAMYVDKATGRPPS